MKTFGIWESDDERMAVLLANEQEDAFDPLEFFLWSAREKGVKRIGQIEIEDKDNLLGNWLQIR